MVSFFSEFRIVTLWNYIDDEHMEETKRERQKQINDICKHFGISWGKAKLRLIPIPESVMKHDNVVMFTRGTAVSVEWRCKTTMAKWVTFCEGINDYVYDKNYADFDVYSSPR